MNRIVWAFAFGLLLAAPVWAIDSWVDPAGSDTNVGSQASPFREIIKAVSVMGPGDTVHIADGNYAGPVIITLTGTARAPITFKATGTGAFVDSGGPSTVAIMIVSSAYIVIDGLQVTNPSSYGVLVNHSDHITVRNGQYAGAQFEGIFAQTCNELLIENNVCSGTTAGDGIRVQADSNNLTIRKNTCFNNAWSGIWVEGELAGGGDGTTDVFLIERNVIYGNGASGGAALLCDGVADGTIQNNVIYGNAGRGLQLIQNGGLNTVNVVVANNTIVMPGPGPGFSALEVANTQGNHVIFNNIFITEDPAQIQITFAVAQDVSGLVCDFNIFGPDNGGTLTASTDGGKTGLSLAQWQALSHDGNSLASPSAALFFFPSAGDFHLKEGSPAIGAGTLLIAGHPAPSTDMDGQVRPANGTIDIGADEFNSHPPGTGCGLTGLEWCWVAVWTLRRRARRRAARPGSFAPLRGM